MTGCELGSWDAMSTLTLERTELHRGGVAKVVHLIDHERSRHGEVEPTVGKYLSGGAPGLSVVLEVAGVTYGPSPVVPNSHRPVWDYTFPRPITWKFGDPVTIRLIDYDWSASDVYILTSREGDPLAMRLLSGTIKPAKGGKTTLVFSSDFAMPKLTEPE